MQAVTIPVDEKWVLSSGISTEALARDLRDILAAKLFELRRVTLMQAAAMAGMNAWAFLDYLGSQCVSVLNLSAEELEADLAVS